MATNQKAMNAISQRVLAFILTVVLLCPRSLCFDSSMRNHKLWSLLQSTRSFQPWTEYIYQAYPYWKASVIKRALNDHVVSILEKSTSPRRPSLGLTESRSHHHAPYDFKPPPSHQHITGVSQEPAHLPEYFPEVSQGPGNFPKTFLHGTRNFPGMTHSQRDLPNLPHANTDIAEMPYGVPQGPLEFQEDSHGPRDFPEVAYDPRDSPEVSQGPTNFQKALNGPGNLAEVSYNPKTMPEETFHGVGEVTRDPRDFPKASHDPRNFPDVAQRPKNFPKEFQASAPRPREFSHVSKEHPPRFSTNQMDPTALSTFNNPSPPCKHLRAKGLDTLMQDIVDLRQNGHSRKALLTTTLAAIYREYGTKRRVSNHQFFPPTRISPKQTSKVRHSWRSHNTQPPAPSGDFGEDAYYQDPGSSKAAKPPVEGVEIIVKPTSGSMTDFRQHVTISPEMSVHSALYQASLQFDEEFGYKNPLAFDLGILEEEECHIIAENSGKKADKNNYWIINVFEGHKRIYRSPCIPSRSQLVLRPGNRIEVSFVKVIKPKVQDIAEAGFPQY